MTPERLLAEAEAIVRVRAGDATASPIPGDVESAYKRHVLEQIANELADDQQGITPQERAFLKNYVYRGLLERYGLG